MKNFILPSLVAFIALITCTNTFSQKIVHRDATAKRCGTTERVEAMFRLHPELRNIANRRLPSTNNNYRLQAIVTIPVVVHIVLPNPWIVTDADVQGQIDRLNLDFSGLNPDTANAGSFVGLRGHSQIQFCLAKRTPGGQLTNGIERLASSAGSNINLATDPIKHAANGGLDVWDPNSYLNIWVGVDVSGQGILGYAQFPGTTPANEDGVFLGYDAFGSSSCYTISIYNKGRTGTHEVGHYLGLFHIWGDESACTGDDFRNLTVEGSSVSLPANLANAPGDGNTPNDIGDTPNQAGATTSCPTDIAPDVCAPVGTGKMYQDYMDYTQDACYSMFTKKQVERMEWIVDNARSGLKTSLGCQPPATVSLDALPFQSVNPGGMEAIGCTATSYPSLLGCVSSIQPKLRIKNNGLTTMTSVTAGYRYDNGAAISNSFVVNIPSGGTIVITLPSQALSGGSHTFKFFTFNPNGAADQTPANDTLVSNFTVSGPISLPIVEQFTSATFPPTGWSVSNPDAGSITWSRWTETTPTGVAYSSPASAFVDIYDYDNPGQKDFLWTPPFAVSNPADSVILTFHVAHRSYSTTNDTLELVYSTDCGNTWQQLGGYYKWSNGAGANALATVTPSCTCDFGPASIAQWRQERIAVLPSGIGSPANLMFGWKTITEFGNNVFIDDIYIVDMPTVFTFTGTGNWSVASNWVNSKIPPSTLPSGHEIIINPSSGNSVKNIPVILSAGSRLTVMPGKTLIVP